MARTSRRMSLHQVTKIEKEYFLVANYSRLSVEDGDDVEKNSIGNQQKLCRHYLESHPEMELVETYFDNGYTGMNYNRPGFQRMMDDLRAGKVNCVIVKDISRLGRQFVLTSELVERIFPEMGVRLICINDEYDSDDQTSDASALVLPLKMVMNDYYVKDTSRKIRSGIAAKMACGEFLPAAGSIPYGYIRNPKGNTYDIDHEPAMVVKRIFEQCVEGKSFCAIARELNRDGIPCPGRLRYERGVSKKEVYKDAVWRRETIRKILENQAYTGKRVHGKIGRDKLGLPKKARDPEKWNIIDDTHPAIISEEIFIKAQQVVEQSRLSRKEYIKCPDVGKDYRELFRGKVYCAECGSLMRGAKGCARHGAKTPSRIFFDCGSYQSSGHVKCCSHYVRQEVLLQTVMETLAQQIKISVTVKQLADTLKQRPEVRDYQKQAERQYISVLTKRRNVEAKQERLLEDFTKGIVDQEDYSYMREQYSKQYRDLKEQEKRAATDVRLIEKSMQKVSQWLETLERCQRIPVIDRSLLDALVSRIDIDRNRNIKIYLNFADPFRPLLDLAERMEVRDVG